MTTIFRRFVFTVAAALTAVAGAATAQTPAQPPKTPPPAAAKPPQGPPPAAETPPYSYSPEGRRDPFVSLLTRGSDPASKEARPPGPPGLLIDEITVKGIVRDRTGFIAMIQGADTKTYIVREGEKLLDGSVKSITADSVVFSQDVTDPLSLVKQRERRKQVRPADGGRG